MVNWTWGRSVQKCSRKTSLRNKKTTEKTFSWTSCNESENNRICLQMSSHMMKRGFFNTFRKRRGNRCIGRRHFNENKKTRMSKWNVKAMMIVFFDIRGVNMMNGYLRVKQLIRSATWSTWTSSENERGRKGQNFGRNHGFCIKTMRQLTSYICVTRIF
jgi:hypothetical protein